MLYFVFFNLIIISSCLVLYGSGSCSELNNCNGHGICSINDKCVCFEGWGASTDVTMYRAPDCSAKVCPSGISWGSGPRRDGEAHYVAECSDKGICDRKTGKCMCPAGFEGAACQRLKCPNDCSGHGSCVTMERLATKDVGFPLIDYPVTYESGNSSQAWDSLKIVACVCESTWRVGLGANETQAAEWFGPDCSLRHCPSADNPRTLANETDCSIPRNGSSVVGQSGNLCQVDCAQQGICDYNTGICKCFAGQYGADCSQQLEIPIKRYTAVEAGAQELGKYSNSPNGFRITANQPKVVDEAIRYYLVESDKYPVDEYPVEFAIVNYGMGKLLLGDTSKPKVSEERAKRIENSLYHLNQALNVFNSNDYPTMFGLISIMMAKLFRERATLISNRSFLAERSSPEDSVLYGVDQILEAFPIFFRSKSLIFEHALCSLEAGWLYLLQSEFIDNFRDDSIREQAATYLERAISLVHTIMEKGDRQIYSYPGDKHRRWNPVLSDPKDYPDHVQLLIDSQPFSFIEGSAQYLLGRLYQGWTELNAEVYGSYHSSSGERVLMSTSFEIENQTKAFGYFTQAVRPKYLPKDCFLWADSHHRAAVILIKYPKVVNPDHVEHDDTVINTSDIHLEMAITHLNLALRCPALTSPAAMDLHFHLAQTAISRLQLIIDRIPLGQSVTKALQTHSEGMELVTTVEEHLEEARKRVTPASTQTTQDGYLYFFSCLKISEFRMLEAACRPELQPVEREDFLTDAVEHLIDALNARTLTDNTDLHYVATVQMSQLLLAVKRSYAAAKSYAKCLFTLSVLINRSLYNPEDVQEKLSEETVRQVGQSLAAGARDVPWVKLHFGPISLNERITAGYASWSFEDAPSVKASLGTSSMLDFSAEDTSQYKPGKRNNSLPALLETGEEGASQGTSTSAIYRALPPKGVPPLKLPVLNNKKVYISGEDMAVDAAFHRMDPLDGAPDLKKKPPPPAGPIPLFALGHTPQYNHNEAAKPHSLPGGRLARLDSTLASDYFLGPYGRRMRRQIPATKDMFDIDRNNLRTFGFRNGRAVFLLPSHIKKRSNGKIRSRGSNKAAASGTTSGPAFTMSRGYGPSKSSAASSLVPHKPAEGKADQEDGTGWEGDADGAGSEDGSEIESGGAEEEQFAGDGAGRERSRSIRPNRTQPPPISNSSVAKKRGVFSWLFGGNKKDSTPAASSADQLKKKPGFSLFGALGFRNKDSTADEEYVSSEMWASSQCFYTFNVLSRQSRMQLVLRCSKLEALDGERTNYMLFHTKPKYLNTYYALKKLLTKDCAKLVVPPVSMKDLSSRPFLEVQALFSSQIKICRKLDDFEHLLYNKISKHDSFLPFITCAPVFTRDLADLDKSLLNAESLIMNLANENTLSLYKDEKTQRHGENAVVPQTIVQQGVDEAMSKSQFAYDSVSSAHASSVSAVSLVNVEASVKRQRAEEAEEVAVGKVTLSLSQCLDGGNYLLNGQQGSRDMLETHLAQDECLMVWHMPVVPSQPMQVVLAWRDHSASLYDKFSSHEPVALADLVAGAKKKASKGFAASKGRHTGISEGPHNKGIVMEIAKSDLDASHMLQYVQGFLDALHSQSTPMRATMTADALRALSCALSLTEFLHMIPPHVKSLVICCPAPLRLIPWHLLLIEQSNSTPFVAASVEDKGINEQSPTSPMNKPTELHLLERFCVRLGPTLALFELNETGTRALRHSVGLHRLCAVDGEADGPDRSANVRGTDLEVACVSTVWSADPNDYRILSNDGAVPRAVQTVLFGDANDDNYKMFKQDIYVKRREKTDHLRMNRNSNADEDFVAALELKKQRSRKHGHSNPSYEDASDIDEKPGDEGVDAAESESSSEEEEDGEGGAGTRNKKKRKLTASDHDKKALTMCRVLHISAPKLPLEAPAASERRDANKVQKLFAAIALPRYDKLHTFRDPKYKAKLLRRNREEREDDARDQFSAKDVVQQVFVKNCALCTISRYALVDDLCDIRTPAGWGLCDTNCEFIEALHLAGAKTVLHPLWNGSATGLAALAHLIFQIRFYSTLPANSKSRLSIVETCRSAQLWLRDATADLIIAFIHKAPLPKSARKLIIEELESFVSASLTPAQQDLKRQAQQRAEQAGGLASPSQFTSPEKSGLPTTTFSELGSPSVYVTGDDGEQLGSRIGGTVKFFNHFMYWGSFVLSGSGAAVHHPDLTENKNEGFEQGHISWNDKELNNMSFEASMLRSEGKIAEARELEQLIRKVRIDRIRKNIALARATGARAGRGIMDTIDFLDKALLDQDSDEVSVSTDSEEERRKRRKKKQNKARESDSDEYDDDEEEAAASQANPDPDRRRPSTSSSAALDLSQQQVVESGAPLTSLSKKFVPRALELGSMKPEDIAYEKWKSKVGGLNMVVRDPVLKPRQPTAVAGNNTNSYEYSMLKTVKESANKDESAEDYNARMESLYKKKEKGKDRRLERAASGGVEEDGGEEDDGDSDGVSAKARRAAKRKQLRNADRESESDYEPSEDEVLEEDEDNSDEEGLYAQRKKLRKRKELKKRGQTKKMSRFSQAVREVRGGVRSYSSVVKSLSNNVPDSAAAKEMLLSSLARKGGGNVAAAGEGEEQEQGKCAVS